MTVAKTAVAGGYRLVPATSLLRVQCPVQAAELARALYSAPSAAVWARGGGADATARALLRGELLFVRPPTPALDPYDGSAIPLLSELGDEAPIARSGSGGRPSQSEPTLEYRVVVVDDRGRLRPDARVLLHASHGSREMELDAAATFAEEADVAHLPSEVELVEPLGRLPEVTSGETEHSGTRLELTNLAGAVAKLGQGRAHVVVVSRPVVDVFELEDLAFPTDGRIFRADGIESDEDSDAATGLEVFRVVLQYAAAHPTTSVLVAGHADSVGSDENNLELSEARAEGVLLYLLGERERWAEHCQAHYKTIDIQAALRFIARFTGLACDPGPLDNDWGEQTRKARDLFRERRGLERGVKQTVEDWLAIYDVYDDALAASLETDASGLSERRAALTPLESGLLGCGEHWPQEAVGQDGFECQANRRVEILFLDEGDVEPGVTDLEPPGTGIYDGALRARYISPKAQDHLVRLTLRLCIHDDARLEHAHCFRLHSTDGVVQRELHIPEDPGDELDLHFEGLDPARRYTLEAITDANDLPLVIFDDLPFHDVRNVEPDPEPEPPEEDAEDFPQETA